MSTGKSLEKIFTAIAAHERRRVYRVVAQQDSTRTVDEVASRLLDEKPLRNAPFNAQRRTMTALHHNHLPALDDANIVTYDTSTNRVKAGRNLPFVQSLLETVTANSDSIVCGGQ